MRARSRFPLSLCIALIATAHMSGCGKTPERSLIKSGHYELQGYVHSETTLGMTMAIDRAGRTATLSFPDGSSRVLGWITEPEELWVTGCWADDSDYHTKMQVVALDASTLELEATTLTDPQLVAGCPEFVDELSLAHEGGFISFEPDGRIRPSQCEIEETCFLFTRTNQ